MWLLGCGAQAQGCVVWAWVLLGRWDLPRSGDRTGVSCTGRRVPFMEPGKAHLVVFPYLFVFGCVRSWRSVRGLIHSLPGRQTLWLWCTGLAAPWHGEFSSLTGVEPSPSSLKRILFALLFLFLSVISGCPASSLLCKGAALFAGTRLLHGSSAASLVPGHKLQRRGCGTQA